MDFRSLGTHVSFSTPPVRSSLNHSNFARSGTAPRAEDRVSLDFQTPRPSPLRLLDFTDVATLAGFVYVALVLDGFARRIVRWRVPRSVQGWRVLDALKQALHERRPVQGPVLDHHGDCGSQYVSVK